MSKKTSYLLGMLITIIFGTLLYCYLCDDCHCEAIISGDTDTTVKDNVVATPETDASKVTLNPFSISGLDGDLGITGNDNFNFNLSNFSPIAPVSTGIDMAIGKLKDYLAANPDKSIGITGHYTADETNNSAFPNLFMALYLLVSVLVEAKRQRLIFKPLAIVFELIHWCCILILDKRL